MPVESSQVQADKATVVDVSRVVPRGESLDMICFQVFIGWNAVTLGDCRKTDCVKNRKATRIQ